MKTDGVGVGDVTVLLFSLDVDPLFPNPVEFPTPAVLASDSWHIVSMPCVMGSQRLETQGTSSVGVSKMLICLERGRSFSIAGGLER